MNDRSSVVQRGLGRIVILLIVLVLSAPCLADQLEAFDQALEVYDLASAEKAVGTLPPGPGKSLAEAELALVGRRLNLAWSHLGPLSPKDIPPELSSRYFRLRGALESELEPERARRDFKESLGNARGPRETARVRLSTLEFLLEQEQLPEARKQLRQLIEMDQERIAEEASAAWSQADGQLEQAVVTYQSLIKEARRSAAPMLVVKYQLSLAQCWRLLENHKRSQSLLQECAESALRAGQPRVAALALKAILPANLNLRQLSSWERSYLESAIGRLPPIPERVLLLTDLGASPPVRPDLLHQAYEQSQHMDPLVQAYSGFHYGVHLRTVDWLSARNEMERVWSLLEPYQDEWIMSAPWSVDRIEVLEHLARIARGKRQPEQADEYSRRALELARDFAPVKERHALLRSELIAALAALDLELCRQVWEQMLANFERAKPSVLVSLLPDATEVFRISYDSLNDDLVGYNSWRPPGPIERHLADTLRGRPGLVARYFASCDQVLLNAKRAQHTRMAIDTHLARADALAFLGQLAEADYVLRQAEALVPTDDLYRESFLVLRGNLMARAGELADGSAELARQSELVKATPEQKQFLHVLLAKQAFLEGDHDRALAFLERAIDAKRPKQAILLQAKAMAALGRSEPAIALLDSQEKNRGNVQLLSLLLARQGEVERARLLNDEMLESAPASASPLATAVALADRAEIESQAGSNATAADYYQAALTALLAARAKLDPILAKDLLDTAVGNRILAGLPAEAREAARWEPVAPAGAQSQQQLDFSAALASLRAQTADPEPLKAVEVADLPALAASLSEGEVLLHPVTLEQGIAWIYVSRQGYGLRLSAISRGDLDRRVEALVSAASSPGTDIDFLRGLSRDLSRSLLEPVRDQLVGARSLEIVPTGPLAQLPFELLMDERDRYLVESFPITYRVTLGTSRAGVRPLASEKLLIYDDKSNLPGARAEAEVFVELMQPTVMNSQSWSPEAFRQRAKTASLIHIAAHGLSQSDDAVSRLSMGVVGLWREDIETLDLPAGSLVVVGACSGARANVSYGSRKESLLATFLGAGASAALGATWEVDDQSASLFFQAFYQALLRGDSVEQVVTKIKRDWLHNPKLSHPFHWAPYVLYR
jgi:CHAT domain-containing protein